MKKPVIGLIPLVDTGRESLWMLPGYMEGVSQAGGVAVMLPLEDGDDALETMLDMCDGFLFTGGHDVDPARYGQTNQGLTGETVPARDSMEWKLMGMALEADKPVLGICRGIQFLNVRLGGTLYQDIPTQFESGVNHHQDPPYHQPIHHVRLSGAMAELLGSGIMVNSCHHQGIRTLGRGLEVMARAEDGLAEAVCLPDRKFCWAVQWHPEFMQHVDENSRSIFRVFVRAAQGGYV